MSGLVGIDSAGDDLQAISYGNLGGSTLNSFTAGHDITQLWARGNLLGTFTADHAIGSVSAYGTINGTFTAGTSSGTHDSTFGQIGSITSWGDISGNVAAAASSGPIQSQGNITATILPSGTSITSHATGLLGGAYPADPGFSLSDAQAALSDASGNATALKQGLAASEAQGASDWAAQQATLATQLTQLQSDDAAALQSAQDAVTANNAAVNTALQGAQADDQTALTNAVTATNQAIRAAQADASTQLAAAQTALSQGTAAVAADQASLTATQTQEKSDATTVQSNETTDYSNAQAQLATYIQNRPQQFFQTALQNFASLPGQLWQAAAFWRAIAAATVDSVLKVATVSSNPISLATFVVGRVLEDTQYHAIGDDLESAAMAVAILPTGGLAEGAAAIDAELGDGLIGAESTAESAATDNAIENAVVGEGDAEMANAALAVPVEAAEDTAAAVSKCVGGTGCFVAGTEVITSYDSTTGVFSQTPIQGIQVGQEVLTRNQYDPDGPLQEQVVTATEQHTAYDLREVTIQGPDGSDETIQATDEHPFYVEGQGFTGAAQLTAGQHIETADGSIATVVSNTDEPEPNGITVYNFTVGTHHTYFVDQSGVAVWVHNDCGVPSTGRFFAGQNGEALFEAAQQYANLLTGPERGRTIAVALAEAEDGSQVWAVANSSKRALTDDVANAVEADGGILVDGLGKLHAEDKLIQWAQSNNLRITGIGSSNSICADCFLDLRELGVI